VLPESVELKERISRLSDEELLEMLTTNSGDYREEALTLARSEALARRLDLSLFAPADQETTTDTEEPAVEPEPLPRAGVCFNCGGRLRYGTLVAEKELTIIFADNKEERFLRVGACRKCGQLSLTVDFETDIQP
jgi:hypothetical protein